MTNSLLSALRMSAVSLLSGAAPERRAEAVTADGRALPFTGAKLRVEARGGIARAILEQRFENRDDATLNITYRMPLPADGAVSAYAFQIGARRIAGVVDRKAAAREKFERAIAAGHTAALLEQDRDDIFTQQIGNIPPNETIVATIAVDVRLAWLPEGEWEFRFPTVIGPRFSTTEADLRATAVDTRPEGIAARISIELAIGDDLVDGRTPSSPSHPLAHAGGVTTLADAAKLDRDIVVRWPVASAAVGIAVASARPATGDHAYGLLTIVPPIAAAAKSSPRDLIILLDTSGSMGGAPLAKAQQVLPLLVESLGESDRLEVIEFSDAPRRWKAQPVAATAREKAEAIKWIRSRTASGGTEIGLATLEALSTLRIGAQRQVVVVTDGYVGGERQLLDVLHKKLPKSCRLHVLGVGAAVNRALATALARAGRGVEIIVGPDEDAERGAKRLLDRTARPVLTNLEIAGTALVRHAPEHVPDVFAGAPVVAALQLKPEGGTIVVRGELAGEPWEQRVAVRGKRAGEGEPAIIALYAREHVADLESRAAMEPGMHDREIETTGVAFQIATRLTSWVAVDASRVALEGPFREASIPQELPYGTAAQAFGLRPAAAPMAMPMQMQMQTRTGGYASFDEDLAMGAAVAPMKPMKTLALGGAPSAPTPVPAQPAMTAPKSSRPLYLVVLLVILALLGLLYWLL